MARAVYGKSSPMARPMARAVHGKSNPVPWQEQSMASPVPWHVQWQEQSMASPIQSHGKSSPRQVQSNGKSSPWQVQSQIAYETLVRQAVRLIFSTRAVVNINPTMQGVQLVVILYFTCSWLCYMWIC